MMQPRMPTLVRRFSRICGLFALVAGLFVGCGDDRDPRDSKTLYGCSTKSDCLANYECVCGFCQTGGATLGCDGSANDGGGEDTPGKDAGGLTDTGPTDTGPTDAGAKADTAADTGPPANCNILTWIPCPTGQGCYYDSAASKGVCGPHGKKKKNDACSTSEIPQCGKDGETPMLCDSVDSKCYPMCAASKGGPCPSGHQCYVLEENKKPWPDDAGICAP